ncbi:PepSY domain-containing protein [Sinimarinibacterium flocculans]|uniref:PepSY domain-containing protein n=1 Tax=Sinimarinibacterium flocculans TaxID=985250 RepID=UPI003514BF05
MLGIAAAGASVPVSADQEGLLQRRLVDPGIVMPRTTPVPRFREPRLSATDAARQVQRRYGGRVLSVQEENNGGYRVKVLKDGEVRIYKIHP